MFIIEVIPLTLLPPNVPQILSYFFEKELQKGAIVEISLNKRKIKAVVISSASLEKEKLSLKKVDFKIKKLDKILYETPQVSDYQLKLAVWISKYYHAPLGYALKTILPSFVFKKKFKTVIPEESFVERKNIILPQLLIYKSRKLVNYIDSLVREVVSSSKQVLIIVPEKTLIGYFSDYFSKKFNTAIVRSGLPNVAAFDVWTNAQSEKISLVIGTRQALNMHFKCLGLVIVEDPLHEFYKSDMMPRYNAAALAHKVATLNNAKLVLTSIVPGVENYFKSKTGIYVLKNLEARHKFESEVIDMSLETRNANWSIISRKLNDEIIEHVKNNKKVLIFSPRRGYAGILICGNCGSTLKCPQCDVAMRTHRSVEMILACHRCGMSRPIPKNCPICGNYNLKTVGPAGTQKIFDTIKSNLITAGLQSTVLALDSDIAKNETEEEEIVSEIKKAKSAILIATQMVLSHRLNANFDLIGIMNSDSLMNMPDFRSEENLFYQVEKLLNFEPTKLLVQTYNPENKILEKAIHGEYESFYDNELNIREALNYPPFYKFVKLTFKHKDKNKASYAARITTEKLKMAIARAKSGEDIKIIEATPAYIEKERNLYIFNIFLKVKEGYKDISQLLRHVEPGWIIDIEPRSLL